MTIHVVRHGETDDNVVGRYSGNINTDINDTGKKQAFELSEKLKLHEYDLIFSSPLMRALRTAEIINIERKLPIITMSQFRERELGVYEGLTHSEIQTKYPKLWARNATRSADDAPDGGETLRQFYQRVVDGLKHLIDNYSGKNVLLVCHAGTAIAINGYLNNLTFQDMFSFRINNCEYAEYIV